MSDLNPPDLDQEIKRGHEAQAILDNTEFNTVMNELLQEQTNRFLLSAPDGADEREDAHLMVRALQRLMARLTKIAETGRLASIQKEDEERDRAQTPPDE